MEDGARGAGDADEAGAEVGVDGVVGGQEAEDDRVGSGGEEGLGLARRQDVVGGRGDEPAGARAHHRGDREG